MFKTQTTLDRKDYFKMNVYYLRRFFGVREGILVALLLVGGFVLLFAFDQWIIAMLAGIAILIMIAAMIAYLALSDKGYREEYEKRHTEKINVSFDEEDFTVEVMEERGERSYSERRGYDAVEKIALLKDRLYLFLGAGVAYYVKYDDLTEGDFGNLCEFLRSKVHPMAFKMRASRRKNRQFPYGRV